MLLIVAHFWADFVFQSDAMAKGKNRNRPVDPNLLPPGQKVQTVWPYYLTAHAVIHGSLVTLVTGTIWVGIAEIVAHWIIDFGKCENWYGIHQDQALHLLCKIIYAILIV